MKKISKETGELLKKLRDAVQEEGGTCVISIGKGKYFSQAVYGSADDVVSLLCCGVDSVADDTGETPISILVKMMSIMLAVRGDK